MKRRRAKKNTGAAVESFTLEDQPAISRTATSHHQIRIEVGSQGVRSHATTTTLYSSAPPLDTICPTHDNWLEEDHHQPSTPLDHNSHKSFDELRNSSSVMDPELSTQWDEEHNLYGTRPRSAADDPTLRWTQFCRDLYLAEIIRLDGRADSQGTACPFCNALEPSYRCADCFGGELVCKACIVVLHKRSPLHVIKKWNSSYFEDTSLKELGLRIQLGHHPGVRCVNPEKSPNDDFVIIDSHGIHEVSLDYCGCETAKPVDIQLLRASLYPVTSTNPKSAATFRVLREFHLLSFESKCSGQEFYHSLTRLTDNTGSHPARDRYDEFLRVVFQWRNLRALKRSGRGHTEGGIGQTKPGELALKCPACPQPMINLPSDWELAPNFSKFLYALFLAIDANFRLKRKDVSSEQRNPSLNQGWSFFVKEEPYKAHLTKHWDTKQDRSTCVEHEAVNNPLKNANGLAATGAVTVDCARHNLKRPNGVGDIQRGERYLNTDYVFLQTLVGTMVQMLVVSYDIACQWHKNFRDRMNIFPHHERLSNGVRSIVYLVPKFHLPAHIEECNLLFSFNLTEGVGRTDGEAPERGWANINPLASSTKEMGPGHRRDTLDDHFNDWNWKKIIKFEGTTLMTKIQDAVQKRNDQILNHDDFQATMSPEMIAKWTFAVEDWEADANKPNPFKAVRKTITAHSVRLKLAKEVELCDAKESDKEVYPSHSSDVHASVMINMGLQLEEDQYRIGRSIASLGAHSTSNQRANIAEHSNRLRRRISNWIQVQNLHLPFVHGLRAAESEKASLNNATSAVDLIFLYLPSSLINTNHPPVPPDLLRFELQLREGLAYDSLHEIHQQLRIRAHLFKGKDRNDIGVKHHTRSQAAINKIQAKITDAVARYRVHRCAMSNLTKGSDNQAWKLTLLPLLDKDIRALSIGLSGESEGTRTTSWIWTTAGGPVKDGKDADTDEALRIEWCRSRARARRFAEEVILLQEEMRRVLTFFDWEVKKWLNHAEQAPDQVPVGDYRKCDDHHESAIAYAKRQAHIRRALRARFAQQWRDVPKFVRLADDALKTNGRVPKMWSMFIDVNSTTLEECIHIS